MVFIEQNTFQETHLSKYHFTVFIMVYKEYNSVRFQDALQGAQLSAVFMNNPPASE